MQELRAVRVLFLISTAVLAHSLSYQSVWAAFVNAIGADGLSDLWIMILSMCAFGCGFILGLFEFGRIAGIAALGALGGIAIGVRIVLFRPGLLVPSPFWANWVICAALGVITFVLVIWKQRAAIVSCTVLALSPVPY